MLKTGKQRLWEAQQKAIKEGWLDERGKKIYTINKKMKVKKNPYLNVHTDVWNLSKLTSEQEKKFSEALQKNNGEIDVWTHPFYKIGKNAGDEKQLHVLKNIHNYLRESNRPLLVFAEEHGKLAESEYEYVKELFSGFGIKRQVIFVKTSIGSPYPALTTEIREKIKNLGFQEYEHTEEKEQKVIALGIKNRLSSLGVKTANIFGEKYKSETDSGCVKGVKEIFELGKEPIRVKILMGKVYPYD